MQTHKNRSCVCCSGIWTWNKPLFFTHFHFCKPMKCKCHTFWVFSVNRVCHSRSWRLPAYLRARLAGQKYPYGFQGLYIHQTQDVSQDWREEGESFWIPEASLHKIFRRHALFKKKKVGLYSKKDLMVLFIFFFWKKKAFALYHLMIESLMPSGSQRDGLFEAIVLILLQERRLCFSSCYFDQNKWCLLSLKFKCNIIFDDNKEYYPLCIHSCC